MRWFLSLVITLTFVATVQAQSTCGATINILQGDTLDTLSARCNTSVEELIRLNPGVETGLQVGSVLRLPQYNIATLPPVIAVSPLSGGPTTPLLVTGNGFPAYTSVLVRMGSVRQGTAVLEQVTTSSQGVFRLDMTIPETAVIGEDFVVIAETVDGLYSARSYGINVRFATGRLFDTTTIYFIALADDGRQGERVACRDSVVAVEVDIEPTVAPLRAGLETLIANRDRFYNQTGLYNPLNQSDLTVAWVAINDGVARIEFTGELVANGECDAQRIVAQLEALAQQFFTVNDTEILVNGLTIESVLGLEPEEPDIEEGTPLPIPTAAVTIEGES